MRLMIRAEILLVQRIATAASLSVYAVRRCIRSGESKAAVQQQRTLLRAARRRRRLADAASSPARKRGVIHPQFWQATSMNPPMPPRPRGEGVGRGGEAVLLRRKGSISAEAVAGMADKLRGRVRDLRTGALRGKKR